MPSTFLKVKEGADIKTVISCHLVNDIKTEVVDLIKDRH